MKKEETYEIGYISRIHGLKGELILIFDVDYPEDYEDIETVYLEQKNRLIPFTVEALRAKNHKEWIVGFEDIDKPEDAEPLVGSKLFLPLDELPDLDENQYYFHDLIGMELHDVEKGVLGTVEAIFEANEQFLIQFHNQGKEVLLPIVDAFIPKVDKEARIVHTHLPDGLLELYLNLNTKDKNEADEEWM